MNLTEAKKSIEKQLSRELRQGSKRNIAFWYGESYAVRSMFERYSILFGKVLGIMIIERGA